MSKKKADKELLKAASMETSPKSGGEEKEPKNMNPKAEEEVQTGSAAHLGHPQLHTKHNKDMPELTNDLAYFLHHPQLAPEHKQYSAKEPKGK